MKTYRDYRQRDPSRLSQAIELATCGTYFSDVDHSSGTLSQRYVSEHMLRCLGLDASNHDLPEIGFSRSAWWQLVHPDDVQRIQSELRDALAQALTPNGAGTRQHSMQYRMRRGDGTYRHTRETGQLLSDESNGGKQWLGVLTDIDAQVRADDKLRQSTQEMQWVIDTIPTFLWIKDHEHRILTVNRAAAEASGLERSEIEGRLTQEVYPDLGHQDIESDDRLIQSGSPLHQVTERLVTQSGDVVEMLIDKYPISGHGESEDRILVIGTDVTAIANAEKAIEHSDQKFRHLFDSSPIGMLLVARDGKIRLANSQAERIFGYDPSEMIGIGIESLVPESRRRRHQKHRHDYTDSPSTRRMGEGNEFAGQQKDGTRIMVEVALGQIEIDGESITMATVIDVSERSRTGNLLQLAAEVGNVGFWEFDIQRDKVHVSDQLLRQLGLKQKWTSLAAFQALLHPDDIELTLNAFSDYLAGTQQQYEVIFRMMHADGQYRWILSRGRKILDSDNTAIQIVGFHIEITQQYESRLDLEEKTKELQRSNQDLDRFAYIASHDLKAPLRGITHLTEWIEEDLPDNAGTEVQKHLSMLNKQVQRMDLLLDDLLAYSRVGRKRRQMEMIDTRIIVRELFQFMSPPDHAELIVDENLPVFLTARALLEQVLRNLIGNAIQHGQTDHCQVHVSCRQADQQYYFCVSDNGQGIEPAFHERIFRMFETLKPKADGTGTGMGLAMVQRLCDHHGGKCWVESEVGQGANFYFSWPVNLEATLQRLRDRDTRGFVPTQPNA